MKPVIKIEYESREALNLIGKLIQRVNNPKKLVRQIERYVHAVTMQMFRGRRPDVGGRRGVKWKRLEDSTIDQKVRLKRAGKLYGGDTPRRPMVRSGVLRDSLRVLARSQKGFVYGTKVKSEKGFAYPGFHNANSFKFLFVNRKDVAQIAKMLQDFLKGNLKLARNYIKK